MKKLVLTLTLLLFATTGHTASYYFSSSTGSNSTGDGSIGNPYHDFRGTTLDNDGALACGDHIKLKRGDTWTGSEAEIIIASGTTACSGNPIYVEAYGSGANPILYGASVTSSGWSLSSSKSSVTVDSATDTITLSSNNFHDGDQVKFSATSMPGGLTSGTTYYVTNCGSGATCGSSFKLATTHANALNTSVINITSNGTSVQAYTDTYVQSTAQSQTHLRSVTQGDDLGLGLWMGLNTTLQEGTFKRSGTTLYVRLWGDADPSSANVRIANFAHTEDADGSRGLLSSGERSDGNARGHYVYSRDIKIVNTNGVGWSASGTHNKTANLDVVGSGMDGMKPYSDLTGSLENSDYYEDYGSEISYSAANATTGGSGQGWTTYSSYNWNFRTYAHHNFMAGIDWLNFGPSTRVEETGCLWCVATYNGISRNNPSFDANFYIDGGSKYLMYNWDCMGAGRLEGAASNSRACISFGSEHPVTDPTTDVYLINGKTYENKWAAQESDNKPCCGTANSANITNVWIAYVTAVAYRGGTTSYVMNFGDADTTIAHGYHIFNSIFYPENSSTINFAKTSHDFLDADYNQYYRQGGSDVTYHFGGSSRTLAQWQSLSSEDAHSNFGDPLFVNDTEGSYDFTLQPGSPAIDRGTPNSWTIPSWIPQVIRDYLGTYGIRGSTLASGVEDNYATAPDAGYHNDYPWLLSTNVEPASLLTDASGNVTITFTIPQYLGYIPYNGRIKVTFPAGFTFDQGGTTNVTTSTISGTFTTTNSGQDVTITRVGDGDSEFPGTYSITISNVKNPSTPGAGGQYGIKILDSLTTSYPGNEIISGVSDVTADTFVDSGGGGGSGGATTNHFSCNSMVAKGLILH